MYITTKHDNHQMKQFTAEDTTAKNNKLIMWK